MRRSNSSRHRLNPGKAFELSRGVTLLPWYCILYTVRMPTTHRTINATSSTKSPKKGRDGMRYEVVPVDVDGDGIPDGDLVMYIKGNTIVKRVFIPADKMKQLAQNIIDDQNARPVRGGAGADIRVLSETAMARQTSSSTSAAPAHQQAEVPVSKVIVSKKTSFGQSLMDGFGFGIGFGIADAAVDTIF